MTKTEKDLAVRFMALKLNYSLSIIRYVSVNNRPYFKLRTFDGRPLSLITPAKRDLLENKGYIRGEIFNLPRLLREYAAWLEKKNRPKKNAKRS
jgi:hypothetical protein